MKYHEVGSGGSSVLIEFQLLRRRFHGRKTWLPDNVVAATLTQNLMGPILGDRQWPEVRFDCLLHSQFISSHTKPKPVSVAGSPHPGSAAADGFDVFSFKTCGFVMFCTLLCLELRWDLGAL